MDAQGLNGSLSIIVPTLNEADGIEEFLRMLAPARAAGCEVIVADGGSDDATVARAVRHCDLVVMAPRGRGAQMNAGAARATRDILLFLHADTHPPRDFWRIARDELSNSAREWGRFDIVIESRSPLLRLVGAMMNLRSRWTGIATGDQAIFVRADAFRAAGGFADIPLMEDIEFSRRMKRRGAPARSRARVVTSGRRWEKHGVVRTILLMWRLRAAYFMGADPRELAVKYGYRPRET